MSDMEQTARCFQTFDLRRRLRLLSASEHYISISEDEAHSLSGRTITALSSLATVNFERVWQPLPGPVPMKKAGSRYSDGSHDILYTGSTEEVAITERCFHTMRESFYRGFYHPLEGFVVYQCDVWGAAVDLVADVHTKPELVHPKDYGSCQAIGRQAILDGTAIIKAPSARKFGGVCVNVLKQGNAKPGPATKSFDVLWDTSKLTPFLIDHQTKAKADVIVDDVYGKVIGGSTMIPPSP